MLPWEPFALHVLGDPCELTVGDAPVAADRDDLPAPYRLDTVLLGRRGREALFASVMVPRGERVSVQQIPGGVVVRRGAAEDTILYGAPPARASLARREAGRLTRVFIFDGSRLSLPEGEVVVRCGGSVEIELLPSEIRVHNHGASAVTVELRGFTTRPVAVEAQPGLTVIRR